MENKNNTRSGQVGHHMQWPDTCYMENKNKTRSGWASHAMAGYMLS